jgi:hypothetical protein
VCVGGGGVRRGGGFCTAKLSFAAMGHLPDSCRYVCGVGVGGWGGVGGRGGEGGIDRRVGIWGCKGGAMKQQCLL